MFICELLFQFHKGTIKTILLPTMLRNTLHFNSIKVRLKPNEEKATFPTFNLFQFHKGTIKTSTRIRLWFNTKNFNSIKVRLKHPSPDPSPFQFHKGTIKTSVGFIGFSHRLQHFNSIKVRLKPAGEPYTVPSSLFQFHKGTIKTTTFRAHYHGCLISIP